MRRRDRGRGIAAAPRKRIIRITSRTCAVYDEPSKLGDLLCQLATGIYLQVMETKNVDDIEWIKSPPGWISSIDSNGFPCYEDSDEVSANKMWATEFDNRRRRRGNYTTD